ncbi:hypothetical protein [Salicibibacter kimchii]|uniref:hypothetical protein n=1 Tax=Salicibibacter kimchii TaxID=2099786 RepID=UPI0013581DFD|nr:hypothetical protein [Salicibibacter kimchii]
MNVVKYVTFFISIIILSITFPSTISAHSFIENPTAAETINNTDGSAGWIPTAALLLIMIGALVFFVSRRNKS